MTQYGMGDPAMLSTRQLEQPDNDFWRTPAWVTQALLSRIKTPPRVWEPACGDGAMAAVLVERGHDVHATDLIDRGYGGGGADFLTAAAPFDLSETAIITNPPYEGGLSDHFVARALAHRPQMVAMLLRNEWDSAGKRDVFLRKGSGFAAKLVLTRRPRWIADTKGSPRHNYAWYVWWRGHTTSPALLYGR